MGVIRRPEGRRLMGAGGGDQARFWPGHDQNSPDRLGWRQHVEKDSRSVISQGRLHARYLSCGREARGARTALSQGRQRRAEGRGGETQDAGLRRQGRGIAGTAAPLVASSARKWSGDQGAASGPGGDHPLPGIQGGDDALWRMAQTGSGNRHRPSGRGGAAFGGRAPRLLGYALAAAKSGSRAAFALHRVKRRLGQICRLHAETYPRSTPPRPTGQNTDRSTPGTGGGSMNKTLALAAAPISLGGRRGVAE